MWDAEGAKTTFCLQSKHVFESNHALFTHFFASLLQPRFKLNCSLYFFLFQLSKMSHWELFPSVENQQVCSWTLLENQQTGSTGERWIINDSKKEIVVSTMPRGNKIVHSSSNSIFGDGKSYQDINNEIYWICIAMASIITFLIVLALSYIAYEKWQKYRELQY